MTSLLGKLNLRPQERRLVVLVLIVVFVVLNVWLVWPHFGDWTLFTLRRDRAQHTLDLYAREVARIKAYQVKLRELESAGSSVVPDEQGLDLVRKVNNLAQSSKLFVIGADSRPRVTQNTKTNSFFEEQYLTLHANSDTEELINFLVSLTSTNSLIRVKDLQLKIADASGTKLDENMTLVASYQRSTPSKAAPSTPAPVSNSPAAKALTPRAPHTLAKTNKPGPTWMTSHTDRLIPSRSRMTNQPPKRP
jgi:Tfp pilus assembly protein PilO